MKSMVALLTLAERRFGLETRHNNNEWQIFLSYSMSSRSGPSFHEMIFSTTLLGIPIKTPSISYARPTSYMKIN